MDTMTEQELHDLIASGETPTVEFKSDQGPLSDTDLLETVVCLANGQGGTLLVGVEDDGRVTGLHPHHRTHPGALAALITNRTVPPVTVQAEFVDLPEGTVAVLVVSAARQPVSTSDGRLLIRYRDTHNRPGCRPLYAYELTNWLAERGQADASALVVPDATWDDLERLEFARLRRMVQENRGDAALLELADQEIARALGLVRDENGTLIPTLAGLLLVGSESALRDHAPAHEVAFQVLRGTDVAVNEFRRWPLLRVHEWLMQAIGVRNEEQELMVGSFRVGVPRYDRRGIREAINNALIHRDYTQLGAVHVQLYDDYVLVTNPGGFVTGVYVGNLLTAAPRPRNPLLADAFKRVGLVERTGRGVGIIYIGQLQNGRRPPDYGRSTNVNVTVTLDSGPADLDFVRLSIQANKQMGQALRVEELLALWAVWQAGKTNAEDLAPLLQQDVNGAATLLAELARVGLLQTMEEVYTLAVDWSQTRGKAPPTLSPAAAILAHVKAQGHITRREAAAVTGLSKEQVRYQLRKLTEGGALELVGSGRGAYYRAPQTRKNGE
jgi:ATP-dependent DNA helicase RecG